jgi:hypothetical protein
VLVFGAVMSGFAAVGSRRGLTMRWWLGLALIAAYLALTIFVIIEPGTKFHHYFLLATGPITLIFLWIARLWRKSSGSPSARPLPVAWAISFVVVATLPALLWRELDPFSEGPARQIFHMPPMADEPVVHFINSMAKPGDTLVIWGWVPSYFVATQLSPGSHEVVGGDYELPGPGGDAARARLLGDMEKSRPRFFVDAVGVFFWPSWPQPIERCRATAYPSMADYLAQHYTLMTSLIPSDTGLHDNMGRTNLPVLVYVRKD